MQKALVRGQPVCRCQQEVGMTEEQSLMMWLRNVAACRD